MDRTEKVKKMGLVGSLLYFGVPTLMFYFSTNFLMQELNRRGIHQFINMSLSHLLILLIMLIASLVAYKKEGNSFTKENFCKRFRLKRMNRVDWIYTLILIAIMATTFIALGFTSKWLIEFDLFSPPEFLFPSQDPRLEGTSDKLIMTSYLGITLKGQWWVAIVMSVYILINILGEEFWWRGYIWPRQEKVFKKWTWLIHGMLWVLFHLNFKWNLIIYLANCIPFSYIIQKRKNTWIAIIAHLVINGSVVIGLIIGIIG